MNESFQHRQRFGIRFAGYIAVEIVKLANLGISAPEQFQVKLCCDGAQKFGCDARRKVVHAASPGPEIILFARGGFGQSGKGTLKRMAVGIDKTRQQSACKWHSFGRRRQHICFHIRPAIILSNGQQDVALPAVGQPSQGCPQSFGRDRLKRHDGLQASAVMMSFSKIGSRRPARSGSIR